MGQCAGHGIRPLPTFCVPRIYCIYKQLSWRAYPKTKEQSPIVHSLLQEQGLLIRQCTPGCQYRGYVLGKQFRYAYRYFPVHLIQVRHVNRTCGHLCRTKATAWHCWLIHFHNSTCYQAQHCLTTPITSWMVPNLLNLTSMFQVVEATCIRWDNFSSWCPAPIHSQT